MSEDDGLLPLPTADDLRLLRQVDPPIEYPPGMNRGRKAPRSSRSDRDYIPAALRNWRSAHGLSQRQAQARIGMSSKTNSWGLWESGATAPTYKNLLKIIAATGLGHWLDEERRNDMDATIRFEADVKAEKKARRERRKQQLG